MRALFTSLLAALSIPTACGGGARAFAPPVDTECVQGAPFAGGVTTLYSRYEPQVRDRLANAHSMAEEHAVLATVAQVLAEQESDLRALRAPAADADAVAALAAADENMRSTAVELSDDDFETLLQAMPAFAAAAQARARAARDLQLRAEFVQGECAS